jgi:predicted nucleic acid-binding protein
MRYLLDTNIVFDPIRNPQGRVAEWPHIGRGK